MKKLHDGGLNQRPPDRLQEEGPRLSEEHETILTALALCTLAAESRINHLILEVCEADQISRRKGRWMLERGRLSQK